MGEMVSQIPIDKQGKVGNAGKTISKINRNPCFPYPHPAQKIPITGAHNISKQTGYAPHQEVRLQRSCWVVMASMIHKTDLCQTPD